MNPRDYTKLTETLRSILMTRIQAGSLGAPTLPKVSQELQQLLDDQKVDQTKLTKLVENDPGLGRQCHARRQMGCTAVRVKWRASVKPSLTLAFAVSRIF